VARFGINLPWPEVGASSSLMTARVRRDYVVADYRTPLSIKAVASGQAWYETPQGRYLVSPDVFLILNGGQHYSMDVPASFGTTTLCPFFAGDFVEAAVASIRSSDEQQLDGIDTAPVEFCERLYPMAGGVAAVLDRLRGAAAYPRGSTPEWIEDAFHDLAVALAGVRDDVRRDIARFPAVRRSTREELYRRLHRGRDFLASSFTEKVSVADAARAAAMSPFHFQRAFKSAFGVTPMQFLQSRRLEIARTLLTRGTRVTEVCFAVGFASLGSFSALYRRRFGAPPSRRLDGRRLENGGETPPGQPARTPALRNPQD